MAQLHIAKEKTLKWEGGYCNVTGDKGGETIFGIARNMHPSLQIWTIVDSYKNNLKPFDKTKYKELERLCFNDENFKACMQEFYKKEFWDKIKGDALESQEVANALYDFAVNSGVSRAVKSIQELLGLKTDGVLGNVSLQAINAQNGKELCSGFVETQYTQSYNFLYSCLKHLITLLSLRKERVKVLHKQS